MNLKRVLRWIGCACAAAVFLALCAAAMVWWSLRASLAQLDGHRGLPGLTARVRIERDGLGVPTIYGTNRLDVTRALGFLHAQDRFFQMDLSRRAGAGELSELFGARALERDRRQRIHRPRARARQALAQASQADAALARAYAEGVNAGLEALKVRPPEYLALRVAPARWLPEDTYLIAYAMFDELHDIEGSHDYEQALLRQAFSPAALAFLSGPDTTWSAALDGSTLTAPPLPGPEDLSATDSQDNAAAERLRDRALARLSAAGTRNSNAPKPAQGTGPAAPDARLRDEPARDDDLEPAAQGTVGSNNWAVDGRRSGTGAAIVANDMHLGLAVPNTWYRARLVYPDPQLGWQDVTGVTLPGAAVVVSGSNGYVAWGNTFSCLDITDLVDLDFDPSNPRRYRALSGWRELEPATEIIKVHHGSDVSLPVDETIWGPVVSKGGKKYALACTMHDPQAVNMGLVQVERARDTETALRQANLSGTPVNNFIVGDRSGHIGYSLLGRLPKRVGFDGTAPCSWADGSRGWQGWVAAADYPRLLDPPSGILWTANNRTLGGPEYTGLHVTSPDNGARARQIRDDLLALDHPSEQTLWTVYQDDRAFFLKPWQELMLEILVKGSATNATWPEARHYVATWGGRAAVDSQGYRLVRAFRGRVLNLLFESANHRLAQLDPELKVLPEDAAWTLLKSRPAYLLNRKFRAYEELLAQAVNQVLAELSSAGLPLAQATWGNRNRLRIRHPMSRAIPRLRRWLDMPEVPVSGDSHMPKVLSPGHGVSERMVVSPGHEQNGLYNMPCGQSGHFLSPFYRTEMDAWLKIQPQPFLPGPRRHILDLVPVRG